MKTFLVAKRFDTNLLSKNARRSTFVVKPQLAPQYLGENKSEAVWLSRNSSGLINALKGHSSQISERQGRIRSLSRLFLLGDVKAEMRAALDSIFKDVIVAPASTTLSIEELIEVFHSSHSGNFVVSGSVDRTVGVLSLIRGNMEKLMVPISAFKRSADGVEPDFNDFSIVDSGQTLKFGEYEASVDSVLYEFDPKFRRLEKAARAKKDRTFGACLRRLRLQRGLRQTDFPNLDAREIGRIERGEVKKPRKSTIEILARVLKVEPNEIVTF